jgi:hypothetical protein
VRRTDPPSNGKCSCGLIGTCRNLPIPRPSCGDNRKATHRTIEDPTSWTKLKRSNRAIQPLTGCETRRRERDDRGVDSRPLVNAPTSRAWTFDLTDEESEALIKELNHIIDGDRFQFSGRVRMLKAIRAKIRPERERRTARKITSGTAAFKHSLTVAAHILPSIP